MKYLAITWLALRHALAARGALVGRLLFYWALMTIFSRLWVAVKPGDSAGYVWYLAITELIALGVPLVYIGIEQDVRRGDIAYRIGRPVSYIASKLAEAVGEFVVRFAVLSTVGMLGTWFLCGRLPADPWSLCFAIPLAFGAGLLMLVIQALIGLSAFWLQDAAPIYWIVQKLMFIFGGLMIPLSIYPRWLHAIADATPFSAMLYGCGRAVLHFDPALVVDTALRLAAWGVLLLALLILVYRRSLTVLTINGG